jgi:hypothetical protein
MTSSRYRRNARRDRMAETADTRRGPVNDGYSMARIRAVTSCVVAHSKNYDAEMAYFALNEFISGRR